MKSPQKSNSMRQMWIKEMQSTGSVQICDAFQLHGWYLFHGWYPSCSSVSACLLLLIQVWSWDLSSCSTALEELQCSAFPIAHQFLAISLLGWMKRVRLCFSSCAPSYVSLWIHSHLTVWRPHNWTYVYHQLLTVVSAAPILISFKIWEHLKQVCRKIKFMTEQASSSCTGRQAKLTSCSNLHLFRSISIVDQVRSGCFSVSLIGTDNTFTHQQRPSLPSRLLLKLELDLKIHLDLLSPW